MSDGKPIITIHLPANVEQVMAALQTVARREHLIGMGHQAIDPDRYMVGIVDRSIMVYEYARGDTDE